METEVEFGSMLHDRFVQRTQQHVVLVVQIGDGKDKQAVVLARVAIDDGRAMVGARPVCPENLAWKRFLQIYHQGFFKS
jgi:hypothetical protein